MTTRKLRRIKPYGRTYQSLQRDLVAIYAPHTRPCSTCYRPVMSGYVCQFCGDSNPTRDPAPPRY